MKKIFMSLMAFAAMALTMTSCNKEEAFTGSNFNVAFEDSEVMNQIKTYFDENHNQIFENDDQFYIMDGSGNIAYYHIDLNATPNYVFDEAVRGNFDQNNGVLTAFYPVSIVYNNNPNEVRLPSVQKTRNGEIQWPLYAQGELADFYFRNLCGNHSIYLTGDVALDSITITTENYLNGHFKVDITNLTNPLKYGTGTGTSRNSGMGHGTRTYSLKFRTPFQLSSDARLVRLTVPAGTYQNYIVTFYANGKKLVKSNTRPITINRSGYSPSNIQVNAADFVDFVPGALNARYNVGTSENPHYVLFSQGNLEYVVLPKQIWRFADNQWDFRGTGQRTIHNQYDRDLFSWGANGYYAGTSVLKGNTYPVWGSGSSFPYSRSTTNLAGNDDWGVNTIVNGGGTGWRTITNDEMGNLLANYSSAMVTLGFNNKSGLVIFANGVNPVADGTVLSKSEWNALQNAGCIFFLAGSHRTTDRTIGNGSYYWLSDASNTNNAYAFGVTNNGLTRGAINKGVGAYVRLVKDVQ